MMFVSAKTACKRRETAKPKHSFNDFQSIPCLTFQNNGLNEINKLFSIEQLRDLIQNNNMSKT